MSASPWLLGNRFADYAISFVFAAAFPVARNLLTTYIYKPFGSRLLFKGKKNDDASTQTADMAKLAKWNESCWKMTCFGLFTLVAFLVSVNEKWFTDSTYFWRDCTALPCNYPVSKKLLLFYCLETGFYLQSIPFLIYYETRRKDFLESMIHHIVTLGLLVYSYYVNLTRVGIMIMLLHDICDVPMEFAKLLKYAGHQTFADAFFALFFITWVAARMVYFPLYIIRSTWYESISVAAIPYNINPQPHHAIFNTLLMVLFVLHCYWSYLIFKILWRALTAGGASDIREDDED